MDERAVLAAARVNPATANLVIPQNMERARTTLLNMTYLTIDARDGCWRVVNRPCSRACCAPCRVGRRLGAVRQARDDQGHIGSLPRWELTREAPNCRGGNV